MSKNTENNVEPAACVVLLHGLGRTARSMRSLENYLRKHEYRTVKHSYPSMSKSIETIANEYLPPMITECEQKAPKIHFVTHSMGGIVLRYYLQTHELPAGSRIVMLSPPNKGSELADHLQKWKWYQWLMGPAGQQLTTDPLSIPNQLQPMEYETGVITGRRTLEPWFSRYFAGENDGKVSVERAKLDEMKDFLVVDHAHSFIMNAEDVQRQVLYFLRNGCFDHAQYK